MYAEDVCVVVSRMKKVQTMQRTLNIIIENSAESGLKINIHKTKAMMVKDTLPAESLVINQTPIEWVNQYTVCTRESS